MKTPWEEIEPRISAAMARARELVLAAAPAGDNSAAANTFALGFCWGAWPVAKLLANDGAETAVDTAHSLPRLRGGVCYHPSFQVGGDVATIAAAVRGPLLLAPCGDDPEDVQEGGLVSQQLSGRSDFAIRPFPDMLHGFMTRGPLEDAAIARCYAEGKGLALDFMRAHAAGGAPAGAGEATRAV